MRKIFFAQKELSVFMLTMLFCSLSSCGTLDISFEQISIDTSETPVASSTTAVLPKPTFLSHSETPNAEETINDDPVSTHATQTSPSPASTSSYLELITIDFIHMANETNGWALGYRTVGDYTYRTILYSQDGGYTWRDMNELGEGSYLITRWAIGFFLDANTGWTVDYDDFRAGSSGDSAKFLRWFNQSVCETEHTSIFGMVSPHGLAEDSTPYLDFVDCDHGWFMFNSFAGVGHHIFGLYSSYDGGFSWVPLIAVSESLCRKTGMDFVDESNGWITNSCPFDPGRAFLEKTEDGGSSWQSIDLPPPGDSPNVFTDALDCMTSYPTLFTPESGSLLVTCYFPDYSEEFFYITHDGAQTWSAQPFPSDFPLFIHQNVGWALGKEIYQTLDGGQTWTKMSTVDWDAQFNFVSDQVGWAVARLGDETALVSTNDGGRTWSIIGPLLVIP